MKRARHLSGLFSTSQRREGMANFARELERMFGNIEDIFEPPSVNVISTERLTRSSLEELFKHRVCAVHVPTFYPKQGAAKLSKTLEGKTTLNWKISSSRGLESSDVLSLGKPYNVAAYEGREAIKAYFDSAEPLMRWWREGESPDQSPVLGPLDKLRLELDEIWPEGSTVRKNAQGQSFLAGIARIMHGPTKFMDGFIHVDELAPMVESGGTFSANIYIKTPPTGGELAIYPLAVKSRWDFYRHAETLSHLTSQDHSGQASLRKQLPRPIQIKVAPGDLVVMCVQRPHAAQGFPMGTRMSVQSFLSFERGKPLMFDT